MLKEIKVASLANQTGIQIEEAVELYNCNGGK